jgi:hypothetical protein
VVEEIVGRLPELTEAQIGRLEEELRRERRRRMKPGTGEGQNARRVKEGPAPPVAEVLEYRPPRGRLSAAGATPLHPS